MLQAKTVNKKIKRQPGKRRKRNCNWVHAKDEQSSASASAWLFILLTVSHEQRHGWSGIGVEMTLADGIEFCTYEMHAEGRRRWADADRIFSDTVLYPSRITPVSLDNTIRHRPVNICPVAGVGLWLVYRVQSSMVAGRRGGPLLLALFISQL